MDNSIKFLICLIITTSALLSLIYVEVINNKTINFKNNNDNLVNVVIYAQGSDNESSDENQEEESSNDEISSSSSKQDNDGEIPLDLESGTERDFTSKKDSIDSK